MYLVWKAVHVLAVVMFFGNIVTGLFWKAHADRTRDPRMIAHVLDGIIRSDRWFTLPAAALILVAGFAAANEGAWPVFATRWIWWSLILFGVSGAIFGAAVAPLQKRMLALARACGSEAELREAGYRRLSLAWEIWGVLAILAPLGAFVLMILKPV